MERVSVCGGVRYGEWNSLVSLNSFFFFQSGGGPGMGFARVLEPLKVCWLFLLVETAPRAPSSRECFKFWLFLVMDKTMVGEKKLCATSV